VIIALIVGRFIALGMAGSMLPGIVVL